MEETEALMTKNNDRTENPSREKQPKKKKKPAQRKLIKTFGYS